MSTFQLINKNLFLCLHEFINSVLLLMQFVPDSSISKASFNHNLNVIVPDLDFFFLCSILNLFCSSSFHFLIYVLVFIVQLAFYCVLLYVFLANWHLVQCVFFMNCLFLLLACKLHFLSYILLLQKSMFVSFCSYMMHLCLFYCFFILYNLSTLTLIDSSKSTLVNNCFTSYYVKTLLSDLMFQILSIT